MVFGICSAQTLSANDNADDDDDDDVDVGKTTKMKIKVFMYNVVHALANWNLENLLKSRRKLEDNGRNINNIWKIHGHECALVGYSVHSLLGFVHHIYCVDISRTHSVYVLRLNVLAVCVCVQCVISKIKDDDHHITINRPWEHNTHMLMHNTKTAKCGSSREGGVRINSNIVII